MKLTYRPNSSERRELRRIVESTTRKKVSELYETRKHNIPTSVRKARLVLSNYSKNIEQKANRLRKKIDAAAHDARDAIYFGSAQEIQAAMAKLEQVKL